MNFYRSGALLNVTNIQVSFIGIGLVGTTSYQVRKINKRSSLKTLENQKDMKDQGSGRNPAGKVQNF